MGDDKKQFEQGMEVLSGFFEALLGWKFVVTKSVNQGGNSSEITTTYEFQKKA